ncbi:tRNA 2'-phosphotransferase 1 [Coccinella septempunctata]|uniref:tRNA 2'-phosphotransferase 1 n=1 Tax=Coccinella septempunctata TaxID=41139 RepID=UPI001D077D34|nr:tRNA 2'-phosphotransferase 1 [Coccinella septempunctata]
MFKTNQNKKNDLGKFLSWILRHGALKEGIPVGVDGFVSVNNLLEHKFVQGRFTERDIIEVVETDEKGRFALRLNENSLDIRANQGHSLNHIQELDLKPITSPINVTCVIHGTFLKNWEKIKSEGLHRMGRNHIHFSQDRPDCNKQISGLRKNSEIFIYINLEAALASGLKFFCSANGVILCPGNQKGFIEPIFFEKVCRSDGSLLKF